MRGREGTCCGGAAVRERAHACAQSYVPESLLLANTQAGVRHRELLLLDQVWRERGGVEACGSL